VNVGASLAGAMLLRAAPDGFWSGSAFRSGTDNQKLDRARAALTASALLDEAPRLQEAADDARRALHAWAYGTFETDADNRALARSLRWPIPWFVAPTDERHDLSELDSVTDAVAGAPETAALFRRLEEEMAG
jgi:hypothetical protein